MTRTQADIEAERKWWKNEITTPPLCMRCGHKKEFKGVYEAYNTRLKSHYTASFWSCPVCGGAKGEG